MVEFNYNRYSQVVENLLIIIGRHRFALVVLYFDMRVDIMLNDNQIKKAIEDGKIKGYYFFHKDDNGKIIKYNNEKSFAEASEFSTYLYSDRLKVTLGPIIKPLKRKRVSSKYRFKDQPEYFDMSKSDDTYILNPGESIIVLTNERIVLDGYHSVLIIPRVSLSEVGIIVTSAYIDPYYNGLLRLNVTNNSQSSHELKTLETIAQCFFFELPDEANKDYESQFSQKSVFLGQNWKAIFEDDRPPFPVKKNKVQTNPVLDVVKYSFHAVFNFVNKNALITALISALVMGWTGYNAFNSYKNNTEKLISNFDSSSTEIIINSGELYGEREVTVRCEKDEILAVLCNNDGVSFEIFSGNDNGTTSIVFSYKLETPQSNKYEVDFTYVVLRKV